MLTFEFGLLWPRFMGRWGDAFGIPFAFEGVFFFTEAIFVSIYIFGWRRLKPWTHFWTGVRSWSPASSVRRPSSPQMRG